MALFKPFPACSVLKVANGTAGDLIAVSQYLMRFAAFSNRDGFRSGELGHTMPFASILGSVACSIIHVLSMGSPSKIAQYVISWVSIVVQRFHPFWFCTQKSGQYKRMNCDFLTFAKTDNLMPTIFRPRLYNPTGNRGYYAVLTQKLSRYGFYVTLIAYLVRTFMSHDRTPLFMHFQSPITKAPLEGVWHQHGLLNFGSYPSHTEKLYG